MSMKQESYEHLLVMVLKPLKAYPHDTNIYYNDDVQ